MGWFGLTRDDDKTDETLFEVSNDRGDHYVASVPTEDADEVRGWFRNAGVKRDDDEQIANRHRPESYYNNRDHDNYRVRSERTVNEREDYEPEVDNDSIEERDEQAAEGGWWFS